MTLLVFLLQHVFIQDQKEFRSMTSPTTMPEELKKLLWWIPFSYLTPCNLKSHSVHPSAWLKDERQINVSNLPDASSFIIANPTDSGMLSPECKQVWSELYM